MSTKTLVATVSADVAELIEGYARSTDQTVSTVVERAIESWAAWEKEKDRLTVEALDSIDRGEWVDHAEIVRWAASLDSDNPLPLPHSRPKS